MALYRVYVFPPAWKEMKELPGYVRHRIRKTVEALAEDPRPSKSKELTVPETQKEVRRLSLENWRVLYAVNEEDRLLNVFAVRRRPPYRYEDLAELVGQFL